MKRKLPAYPLFVKDPNFSLWCTAEELNKTQVTCWFGEEKPLYGFVKLTDGTIWCFLGDVGKTGAKSVKNARQTKVEVSSFKTTYTFDLDGSTFTADFVSPLPLDDPMLVSEPVCYLSYRFSGDAEVEEVSLFVNRRVAYTSDARLPVNDKCRNYSYNLGKDEVAFIGLKRQLYLSNNEDCYGADWGYWYLCGDKAAALDGDDFAKYLLSGEKNFKNLGEEKYIAAFCFEKEGFIEIAYDSVVAIDYFGDFKKSLYLEKHTVLDAIVDVRKNKAKIEARLDEIDRELKIKADKISPDYYEILTASLRQSVAAHTAIKDNEGNLVFLSKENGSNGCIGTLDVSYPSIPLYLIYNTEFVKGMLRPIIRFARMPVWNFDYAPHDVGTYPHCSGNVYGAREDGKYAGLAKTSFGEIHPQYYLFPESNGEYDDNMQMPVEECANMIITLAACYAYDGDLSLYKESEDLCRKWVEFLVKYGLKPTNQLCTDDFAGHIANNLNLAVKASVGIACYAGLLKADGKDYAKYERIARDYAREIEAFSRKFLHSPLTWDDGEDTFGLKYNLLFDKVLDLGLFSQEFREREVDYYLKVTERFGTPIFNRKSYVKSDWTVWAAALTDDKVKRQKMLEPMVYFLQNSPLRIPFGDWYIGDTGEIRYFRARSVVGGCFALLLGIRKDFFNKEEK